MSSTRRRTRLVVAVAALAVTVDQAVKAAIVSELAVGERIELLPGLALVSVRNRGIAFGLLSDAQEWLVIAVTLVALAILIGVFTRAAVGPWGWTGVGLVAGGALGNLADRVRGGSVVDYIKFDFWPAFNFADAAITIGVLLLLLGHFQRERAAPASTWSEEPDGARRDGNDATSGSPRPSAAPARSE